MQASHTESKPDNAAKAVLFWFKRDLRLGDNRGLSEAANKAKSTGIPLICLFIVSPQDYQETTSHQHTSFLRLSTRVAILSLPVHFKISSPAPLLVGCNVPRFVWIPTIRRRSTRSDATLRVIPADLTRM